MRSKVHVKGHPLHPILVGFPIAFYIGAFFFDGLGIIRNELPFITTGLYLEISGIIFTLLAAIPGIIDFYYLLPPGSSAKKRGRTHGILNLFVLLIFAGCLYYRLHYNGNEYILLTAEALGVLVLGLSGWHGGTLVHRNQIGVDHRYANAGKYKEKYFSGDQAEYELLESDELQTDQMMLVHINGKRIVVGKTEKDFVAFDDWCTHRGGSLADGTLICGVVQCPWHGSQFHCETGAVKAGPAREGIKTYTLRKRGNKIFIVL